MNEDSYNVMLFPICGNLLIFIRVEHLLFVDILTKFQRGNYVDMHFSRKMCKGKNDLFKINEENSKYHGIWRLNKTENIKMQKLLDYRNTHQKGT